jgi:hypothetical protein
MFKFLKGMFLAVYGGEGIQLNLHSKLLMILSTLLTSTKKNHVPKKMLRLPHTWKLEYARHMARKKLTKLDKQRQ